MTMRVVSGIQPTGNLHLGNYLGAFRWSEFKTQLLRRRARSPVALI